MSRLATVLLFVGSLGFTSCFSPVCDDPNMVCPDIDEGTGTGALRFDGVDDSLRIESREQPIDQSALTLELWFKTDRDGVLLQERLGNHVRKTLALVEGRVCGTQLAVGEVTVCTTRATFTDRTWHHAALVVDGETGILRLVADGNEAGHAEIPRTSGAVFDTWIEAGGPTYRGMLDEIRVWEVARTTQQLAVNRARLVAPESKGLRVRLDLNESAMATEARNAARPAYQSELQHFELEPSPWRGPGAF